MNIYQKGAMTFCQLCHFALCPKLILFISGLKGSLRLPVSGHPAGDVHRVGDDPATRSIFFCFNHILVKDLKIHGSVSFPNCR